MTTSPPSTNGNHTHSPLSATLQRNASPAQMASSVSIHWTQPEDTSDVLQRARSAQSAWNNLPFAERKALIRRFYEVFFERQEELVELLVTELGKLPFEARFEIIQPLVTMRYMLDNVERVLKPRRVFIWPIAHRKNTVIRRPHGVVMVISPWNFPVVATIDAAIPALLAGNVVIFKPSEHTPCIGQFLGDLMIQAGVPSDVFQVMHGQAETSAALIEQHPDKISFTGSVAVGRQIAQRAGDLLIPVTLELGGNDTAIVLADADIERTARQVVWAGMLNGGQMCLSVERVIVLRPVAEQLVAAMRHAIRQYVVAGTPQDKRATYGKIMLKTQWERIHAHITEAEDRGAQVYRDQPLAHHLARETVLYHEPVLVVNPPEDSAIVREESFGPVIAVQIVDSVEEAINLVNDDDYGLTASIWTRDQKCGEAIARQLHVGTASVNEHVLTAAVPHLPWGGVKQSGIGRTRSREGILAMTVPQVISTERFRLPIDPFSYPYTRWKKSLVRRLIYLIAGPTWRERLRGLWRL